MPARPSVESAVVHRCRWASGSPEMRAYHDQEYGFPVNAPWRLFERLILEIFQAGLSWRTVLAKRRAFRQAFSGFRPRRVAAFTSRDVRRLLNNPGIIRNQLKIQATITNARAFLRISRSPGGFAKFLSALPRSRKLAVKAFKTHFVFMGPEIVGEFLMSIGHWPVKHERDCFLFTARKTNYSAGG